MAVEVITKEDLEAFGEKLLNQMKALEGGNIPKIKINSIYPNIYFAKAKLGAKPICIVLRLVVNMRICSVILKLAVS